WKLDDDIDAVLVLDDVNLRRHRSVAKAGERAPTGKVLERLFDLAEQRSESIDVASEQWRQVWQIGSSHDDLLRHVGNGTIRSDLVENRTTRSQVKIWSSPAR